MGQNYHRSFVVYSDGNLTNKWIYVHVLVHLSRQVDAPAPDPNSGGLKNKEKISQFCVNIFYK